MSVQFGTVRKNLNTTSLFDYARRYFENSVSDFEPRHYCCLVDFFTSTNLSPLGGIF